jgi:6,7-dimethyl-8-ribityllumazine synthase
MSQIARGPDSRSGAAAVSADAAARAGVRVVEGGSDGRELTIAIACARFHEEICDRLLEGAIDGLLKRGVRAGSVTVVRVPGAFELPLAARRLALSGADAVVCLGVVIRGETPHFDYVAGEAARGIALVAAETGVPVLFGVLTVETEAQALDRAGGRHGNKGEEAAEGAIRMANTLRALPAALPARPARETR